MSLVLKARLFLKYLGGKIMHKVQNTSKNLNHYLVKFQKPLVFALFFVMILFFTYSLIFMSPFYDVYILNGNN